MGWKLVDTHDGDITDKDIIEVYTILYYSVLDGHRDIAKKMKYKVDLALLNLEAEKIQKYDDFNMDNCYSCG